MAKNHLAKGATTVIKREIEAAVMRDREEFGIVAADLLNSMALIVLHDKFGFGEKRLKRFQEEFETQADCIIGDYVSIEDMRKLANELTEKVNSYK